MLRPPANRCMCSLENTSNVCCRFRKNKATVDSQQQSRRRGALRKDVPPAKRLFSANNCVKKMSKASALLIFYALFSRKIVCFAGALQFLKCKFFAKAKPQAVGSLTTVKDCRRSISENLPSKTDTSLRRTPQGCFFSGIEGLRDWGRSDAVAVAANLKRSSAFRRPLAHRRRRRPFP